MIKYSDLMLDWMHDLGYRKCFYVAGGNIMHLLDSARRRFECKPFVHEVATVIAAEYFNEVSPDEKAFALVTAGPGLTNAVTGLAGAYLESRSVLLIGGQVKSTDLANGLVRQRGIQEIDGIAIAKSITVVSERIERPVGRNKLTSLLQKGETGRPGPVFLEICLDAQGAPISDEARATLETEPTNTDDAIDISADTEAWRRPLAELVANARRPVLLVGQGVKHDKIRKVIGEIESLQLPVMTTWNGTDRIASDHALYFGRPNTWGQRYSNILLQQADLIIALGSRLSLQQTGFNWQEFAPVGKVVQVDIDAAELDKGHPRVDLPIQADAGQVFDAILAMPFAQDPEWIEFCRMVKGEIPLIEPGINKTGQGFISPHEFVRTLSACLGPRDVIVPCSSGGAFTVMMQVFAQTGRQRVVTNKGLASMGYGLSAALGASIARPEGRVILIEGDGGFAQNLQELGTLAATGANLKIFIFDDNGYASIRMTQRSYFGGDYMGCDTSTGLGLPNWLKVFEAYGIPIQRLGHGWNENVDCLTALDTPGPTAFLVPIDPEQTYFPKIASRITEHGTMMSNPLHHMSPGLAEFSSSKVFKYLVEPYY